MKTKIFIVIDHLGLGGTQRQILEYLKFANRDRFNLTIVTLNKNKDILGNEIKNLGYKIINIDTRGFLNIALLWNLKRLFTIEKPQIVHTFLFSADCYARLAAKLAGVKIIISSVRNVDLWKKLHHLLTDRILNSFTDRIIINAKNIAPFLIQKERVTLDKIITIYNGIDLKRFVGLKNTNEVKESFRIPKDALVIGMAGRFNAQKDYQTLFSAAKMILQQKNNVYFLAIGDGPTKDLYESKISNLKLSNKIIFTGLRKDTPDLINAMDICILSSHYEGCPNVILEYMACSKPVIASRVGGCPELVIDNENGFIVEPKNSVALANKIIQLLNDNNLRQQMGKAGRKKLETYFTAQIMTQQIENLYSKLLKPNIAYILSQFPATSETFILREIEAMKKRNIEIKILSLKPCKDKIIHPEAKTLIKNTVYGKINAFLPIAYCVRYPIRTLNSLFYVLSTYSKNPKELIKALYVWLECFYFVKIVKKEKISHIHSHWATMPTTAALILSKLTVIPFSFTAHAWDIFVNGDGLEEKIQKAKFVVTCTNYNKKFLGYFCNNGESKKIHLNYHGIDLNKFSLRKQLNQREELTILAIGRLVETKGFDYLIQACAILEKKEIDFKCFIVGKGPLEHKLETLVNNLRLNDKIIFLGAKSQEEIKELYNKATVLVQPSIMAKNGDRDGIPNVILEAMAVGTPVIATNFSGIPEAVINQQTGILVPEKDSPAIAEGIQKLWENNSLRNEVAEKARSFAKEMFDTDKNTEQLIGIFQENRILN